MSEQEIKNIFNQDYPYDYKGDRIFKGLCVLSIYIDYDKQDLIRAAEHDIIYSVHISELTNIPESELIFLRKYGWFIDCNTDSLAHYV